VVASFVSLAAGVAAARAIDAVTGLETALKWPNDVLVGGRKVTGILIEAMSEEQAVHYVLLGTGINANFPAVRFPSALRRTATTLSSASRRPVDRRALLQRYLQELEPLWDDLLAGESRAIVEAWRAHPNILGQRVRADRWGEPIEGIATRLDDDGALIVVPDSGEEVRITVGDVQALPQIVDPGHTA
jgi:BirA family biotin operon repressor/biotin-[acetyl-CoA-carboxylase] ligase